MSIGLIKKKKMNTDNMNNCHTFLTKPFGQRAMFYFDYFGFDSCRHTQIKCNKIRNALRSTKKNVLLSCF